MKAHLAMIALAAAMAAGAAHAQTVSSCFVENGETICRQNPSQPPYQPYLPNYWGLANPGPVTTPPGFTNSYIEDRPSSVQVQVNHLLATGRCEEAWHVASEHSDPNLADKVMVMCKP